MKNWFLSTLCVGMVCMLGCGSRETSVVPAPAENVETTIPDLDPNSEEYQKAMTAQ